MGKLAGIKSFEDMRNMLVEDFDGRELYKDPDLYAVNETDGIRVVINKLADKRNRVGAVVVLDDGGRVSGMIRRKGFLAAFYLFSACGETGIDVSAKEIFEKQPHYPIFPKVMTSETLDYAIFIKRRYQCDNVPVVGPDGGFEGFIATYFKGGLVAAFSTVIKNST